jgi:hypothetical protein
MDENCVCGDSLNETEKMCFVNGFLTFNILQVLIINYLCRDEQTEIHRGFELCKKKVFQQLLSFIIFRIYSNNKLIV